MEYIFVAIAMAVVLILVIVFVKTSSTISSDPNPIEQVQQDPLSNFELKNLNYGQTGNLDKISWDKTLKSCAQDCLDFDGCLSFDFGPVGGECHLSRTKITTDDQYNKNLPGLRYYERI